MIPPHWVNRAGAVLLLAIGLFLALALFTFSAADSPFLSSHPQRPPQNLAGTLGAWVGFLGRGGFGWAALGLPLWCGFWGWRWWRGHRGTLHAASLALAVLCLLASAGALLALTHPDGAVKTARGGMVGFLLARAGSYYLGSWGTVITAACVAFLAWLVISGQTLGTTGLGVLRKVTAAVASRRRARSAVTDTKAPVVSELARSVAPTVRLEPELEAAASAEPTTRPRIRSTVDPRSKPGPAPARPSAGGARRPDGFRSPPLDALATPPPIAERQLTEDLQKQARILEETLREFGVEATVVNIDRGPAVTRYELRPAPGVKLTRIVSLADELALVLKTASCHIVAPLPGKGLVGIDVPNVTTTIVYLKEILMTREFQQSHSPLTLPIGKDVSGRPVLADLRDFPHLLIAGATGSGKTVCLNSLLLGILSHATPEQVRFLMIDPKMVEMAAFNGIPHLIAPVVTGAKKASTALGWAVQEMERRYQLLAAAGARNLDLYNQRVGAMGEAGRRSAAGEDAPPFARLPYLVIVIDELADLMMICSQDVEAAITRLAQLSRAVGLHIILATQRPSVDVVTGVIKANFPARIAFQVASKVDSRTILDMNGADKLLGRGDLLFLNPGAAKPVRAQGAYVTDEEIERVTSFLREQGPPAYDERLLEAQRQPASGGGGGFSGDRDELYEQAKQLVLESGQASTSLLQRRLRLGYGRAARILDMMEEEGLVGPPQGSRPRDVLVGRAAESERQA